MLKLFSKNNCPNCTKLKGLLESNGIQFEVVNLDEDINSLQWLKSQGHRSVPQLYLNNNVVGGDWNKQTALTNEQINQIKGE